VEPILKDLPNTRWGYEESQRVMFVADGFAYVHHPELSGDAVGLHLPAECGRISAKGDDFPTVDQVKFFTAAAFYWSRFRDDSDELFSRFEALLSRYATSILAPAHGNVVSDLTRVVPVTKEAHKRAFRAVRRAN
jgi:hypothetical protein